MTEVHVVIRNAEGEVHAEETFQKLDSETWAEFAQRIHEWVLDNQPPGGSVD